MSVRWLIPGESLLINHQVFPLTGCHIVLERQPNRCVNVADRVLTVELWFDQPIDGSVATSSGSSIAEKFFQSRLDSRHAG